MNNILCSEGYKKFFDALPVDTISVEEYMKNLQKAVPLLAEEICLGKLICCLNAPATMYTPKGKDASIILYEGEKGYEETPHTEEYNTGEHGTVRIVAYPQAGHVWTQEEQEAVTFLAKTIFLLSGRIRLMGLMRQAEVIDNMTGVANTSGLTQFGRKMEATGKLESYTGVFFNIRNFKYINQSAGSREGDLVLRKYTNILEGFLKEDELLARLGGDNFFAFVKKEGIQEFLDKLNPIRIDVRFPSGKKEIEIIACAGVYFIQEQDTISDIMNRASVALKSAKASHNHNIIHFRNQMLEKSMREKQISVLFPQAIKNREFVVYYQPKVSLGENRLCGCEALVRWFREGQLVPPMEFIPVLEQEGSVCTLDFYVFENVCRDIREWLDMGIEPVRISVNFSKVHLHNRKLAQDILDVMDKYHVDGKYIEIELTETSGYENYATLAEFVDKMKEKGISTSIDDFGTGYSSLNLLKDLNVDVIKLDKSFLQSLEEGNKPDEIVIKNIVNMVKELHMDVIAEGVETLEQADFLRNIHCCMAQGFLFDRPLPQEEFQDRLTGKRIYVMS